MTKELLTCLFFCSLFFPAQAQKKPLDHSVYDSWQSIENHQLTADGRYLVYEINPQEGDGTLVVRRISDGKEITLPRGYKAQLAKSSLSATALIKAPFSKILEARKKNTKKDKMPKDSLAYIDLANMTVSKYEAVKSYKTDKNAQQYVAYIQSATPDKKKKKNKKAQDGDILVVINTANGKKTIFKNVSQYAIDNTGSRLAVFVNPDKKNKKLKSSAKLYDLASLSSTTLSEGKGYYGGAKFSTDGQQLVFLASTDTISTGDKHCSLFYVKNDAAQEIITQGYSKNLPNGWTLNQNSAPEFSKNGQRIVLGVAPCLPPKDTTLYESETAQLDIWHYLDYQIQPQQKVNLERNKKKTYTSVINLNHPSEIIPLTTAMWDNVSLMDEGNGDWALSQDRTSYYIPSQWDDDENTDLALVSLKDGSRRQIATKVNTRAQVSPDGHYVLWYNLNDSAYYSYDIAAGKTYCLTKQTGVNFYDEEDDHPNQPSPYDMHPQWTADDKSVIISDRYDLWQFAADGSSFDNLTGGKGREQHIQLRHTNIASHPSEHSKYWANKDALPADGKVYMTAFDERTKKNGFATVTAGDKSSYRLNLLDTFSYVNPWKAEQAEVIVYKKGNFAHTNNIYSVASDFSSDTRLSDINLQMKDYLWGSAQLVHWTAFDGTPLDGLLYIPENLDKNKKYPMMTYFYERNSETLYKHSDPRPSRSIVNIPFYCSRGYVVFVPDIIYKVGHPGESAYNCIVSGAKAMVDQFSFIDSTRIAIQGQSWGGYQTAYLVTRTNMFCAAGAGAPVSNMTSAYGGIRWASGVCRQMQYEHGQSRIGNTLWGKGGLDLYIENSPLFKADKVTTPLLIMHNDNDGAVPWYQGIEYFMALRRLGKKVWMLQYNNEAHNLVERRNCKDLSIRLQQFFDHYMQGAPEPAWMKSGVPAVRKGQYFGTELTK